MKKVVQGSIIGVPMPFVTPMESYEELKFKEYPQGVSWITRLGNQKASRCLKGNECEYVLRGCEFFHLDADMITAFEQGIRPVGWTQKHELNVHKEIKHWQARQPCYWQIPSMEKMKEWNKEEDTPEHITKEKKRITALMEYLENKKKEKEKARGLGRERHGGDSSTQAGQRGGIQGAQRKGPGMQAVRFQPQLEGAQRGQKRDRAVSM